MHKRIFLFNEEEHHLLQDERNGTTITSYYFNKKDSILIENNKKGIPFRFDFTFNLFLNLFPEIEKNVTNIVFNNIKLNNFDFKRFNNLKNIFFFKCIIRNLEIDKAYKIHFTSCNDINFTNTNITKKLKKGSLFYEEKKDYLLGINKKITYKIEKRVFLISAEKKKKLRGSSLEKFFSGLPMNKKTFENIKTIRIKNLKIKKFNFCLFIKLRNIVLNNSILDSDNIFPARKIIVSEPGKLLRKI